jgi:hypothetical protein
MTTVVTQDVIESFFTEMLDAWNANDREGFLAIYKRFSPNGFILENPVGTAPTGFEGFEQMADQYQGKVQVENLKLIVNGDEAAAVMRNVGTIDGHSFVHESIEIYRFGADGTMHVRYFAPGD